MSNECKAPTNRFGLYAMVFIILLNVVDPLDHRVKQLDRIERKVSVIEAEINWSLTNRVSVLP